MGSRRRRRLVSIAFYVCAVDEANGFIDDDTGEKGDSGNHHRKMGHMKERLGRVFKHGNH